jgi:hypothetical protein
VRDCGVCRARRSRGGLFPLAYFAFKGDWPEFAKIWNSDRNSQNFGFWPVLRTRIRVCKCHPIGSAEKSPSVFGFYYTIYYTIFPGSSGPLWKLETKQTLSRKLFNAAGAPGWAGSRAPRRARWTGPAPRAPDAGRTTRADRSHGRRQRPAPTHAGRQRPWASERPAALPYTARHPPRRARPRRARGKRAAAIRDAARARPHADQVCGLLPAPLRPPAGTHAHRTLAGQPQVCRGLPHDARGCPRPSRWHACQRPHTSSVVCRWVRRFEEARDRRRRQGAGEEARAAGELR